MVPDMAAASVAAGADGLIIEVHPDPQNAASDGYQTLDFKQFGETMGRCRKIAAALGRDLGGPTG
jgi:3-deoxy-7-phosphoheptulonate synthase